MRQNINYLKTILVILLLIILFGCKYLDNSKEDLIDSAKYYTDITVNFNYIGDGEVSKDNKIIINLDKTDHGYIISTRYLYTNRGVVNFMGIPVNLKYLYLDLAYDRDGSGWHSKGDSFSFYKDENDNAIAIDISKGEVILDLILDDDNIWE